MPTFEERRDRAGQVITLRVKIRRRGFPEVSRSFDVNGSSQAALRQARRVAESWAADIESEMQRGAFVSRAESEQTTLYECLGRYLAEITPHKKGRVQETSRIRNLQKHPLAKKFMAGIRGADLAVFRDDQLQRVGPASVQRDLAILSHVFNVARREWGMENLSNPLQVVRKPKLPNGRSRRVTEEEIDAIVEASESPHLAALVRLAVESAMRRGELISIRWENVNLDKQWLWLPDTKNDTGRHVPLSKKAVRLLRKVRDAAGTAPKGLVFPMQPDSVSRAFARAVSRARSQLTGDLLRSPNGHAPLADLRFHDLRHEATSRLFDRGLHQLEAAAVTGHKDVRMLMRYTHAQAELLAKKLG
ncbi:MAG TPA: site-specific integrase [Methylibium sp.]|uniref:tyrosine-type recombinase/integrase n=1 Tax=Methylibium sp. TaxID=2067992 RepID=UPI002DBBF4BD|nr:site-specific integrase [Methylibium sp.]HEU4458812.1 site-specific integrase [Methylibium sp.]